MALKIAHKEQPRRDKIRKKVALRCYPFGNAVQNQSCFGSTLNDLVET